MPPRATRPYNPQWVHIPEWILGAILCLLLLILLFEHRGTETEKEVWKIRRQAWQVILGCQEYARTHQGQWPPSLRQLPVTSVRATGAWFKQVTPEEWGHLLDDWSSDGRFSYHAYQPAEPPDKVVLEIWSSEAPGQEILARADGTTGSRKISLPVPEASPAASAAAHL